MCNVRVEVKPYLQPRFKFFRQTIVIFLCDKTHSSQRKHTFTDPAPNLLLLFDSILYAPSTIFHLCRNGSSWVEPVLRDYYVSRSRTQYSDAGEAPTRRPSVSSQVLYHFALSHLLLFMAQIHIYLLEGEFPVFEPNCRAALFLQILFDDISTVFGCAVNHIDL